MYHPTTIEELRNRVDGERNVFTAAAVLPHLPDHEALLRIRPEDERIWHTHPDELAEFKRRVPTIGGASNLRRVEPLKTSYKTRVKIRPVPHNIKEYTLGSQVVDLFGPTDDEYDFSDTDQTSLSEFGVTTSATDAVHMGVRRTDDTFGRKPLFPV